MRAGARKAVRLVQLSVGCMLLLVGLVGVFLPLIPGTPLILLGAACVARGSERLHAWLLRSQVFGPTLRDWEEHRSLRLRAKVVAVATVIVSFSLSIVWTDSTSLRIVQGAVGVAVAVFLISLPTRSST